MSLKRCLLGFQNLLLHRLPRPVRLPRREALVQVRVPAVPLRDEAAEGGFEPTDHHFLSGTIVQVEDQLFHEKRISSEFLLDGIFRLKIPIRKFQMSNFNNLIMK